MTRILKPACASWKIWLGPEIEGNTDRGVITCFVRELPPSVGRWDQLMKMMLEHKVSRWWFCEEFFTTYRDAWNVVNLFASMYPKVCVCLDIFQRNKMPDRIPDNVTLYYKLELRHLRKGDHVCIGPKYADEAFEIGTGAKVTPKEYAQDIRIA